MMLKVGKNARGQTSHDAYQNWTAFLGISKEACELSSLQYKYIH